ncbi:type II toxin-antitoxin system RelB/DinJ family antitoxin [Candidatus Azambacteria bacterium]|nr:type II toxin-antitoxin system RelB/DinJ family antitoxin [Candidatus Azambacteria bacterium]MBI3685555.1 type II toxin-antitoxin system RelB/DinJ family antitoxin [Candidatus Azambacteria bacterium]
MNTTVNVRVEKEIKAKANKALLGLGLDMSTAVKMFLYQVVAEQGIPFVPTKNPAAIRARWDAQVADALKRPGYKTAGELHRALLKKAK